MNAAIKQWGAFVIMHSVQQTLTINVKAVIIYATFQLDYGVPMKPFLRKCALNISSKHTAAALLFSIAAVTATVRVNAAPLPLHVQGNQLLNIDDQPVLLRGVDCASMEYTSNGEGHILTTVTTAIKDWHANIIRLPLSQDRWFGKGPEQTDGGVAYRALVARIVSTISSLNSYVILDDHWSDEDQWGKNIGQHLMPDRNSITFWKSFAKVYANNSAVIFDLYNEPHDVSWKIWRDGGPITETDQQKGTKISYDAVGLQTILNTIRSTGAENVALAGGLNWAYDLTGILNGYALSDPTGNGVMYANHYYPFKGITVKQWIADMVAATAKVPVIVSEFGTSPTDKGAKGNRWILETLNAMQEHHWNWTAWDMHPSAGPDLITDWSYTPTPYFGVFVKDALAGKLPPYVADANKPAGN